MSKPAPKNLKAKTSEEVFTGLQMLRSEQRQLANKITELEMDLNEHKIVIETLRGVDKTRKCFRMIGGVLVERTVNEVLPELENNCEQLPKAIKALEEQLENKGRTINEYVQQNNIHWQNVHDKKEQEPEQPAKSNVLVASG
ncbi:prefoldin 2 [Anticarsia gemmatalis]|uniref:prefoldin 2 n=1 Tax=Anticarsia gemmatalis TaxID=129554 RepID=UPI003F75ED2E